ncbi:rhomboid protease ROM9, putative [Plasmodium ovale]|uniref:Rhomboid protease ROM9, putative n=1 Tax=Plasmodium ovale TaxID=36330 RepID=A0A1D3U8Q6_PLAOA|nr:rhomboid protease ROM9, putative [Plasmodium ovale]
MGFQVREKRLTKLFTHVWRLCEGSFSVDGINIDCNRTCGIYPRRTNVDCNRTCGIYPRENRGSVDFPRGREKTWFMYHGHPLRYEVGRTNILKNNHVRKFTRYSQKAEKNEGKMKKNRIHGTDIIKGLHRTRENIHSLLEHVQILKVARKLHKMNRVILEIFSAGEKWIANFVRSSYCEVRLTYALLKKKVKNGLYATQRGNYANLFPSFFHTYTIYMQKNDKSIKHLFYSIAAKGRYSFNNIIYLFKGDLFRNVKKIYRVNGPYYYKRLFIYHYNKSPVTYTLMLLHILIYILWLNAKPIDTTSEFFGGRKKKRKSLYILTSDFMYTYFCCSLQSLREKRLYTLVTNLISHNTIQSFLLNTISLFYIGRSLEMILNSKNFILTYLVSGIISSYVQTLYHKNSYYSNIYVLGASGSISSILATYTLMYPSQNIYLYGVLALPLALFSSLYFLNELYCVLIDKNDNTGHVAHLTGMCLGVLYYYLYVKSRVYR